MVARVDDRLGAAVVGWPDELAVEAHVVRNDGVGDEVVDEQESVMVAFNREGRRSVAEDLDLAGCVGLHPERGTFGSGVAQQRPEDEPGCGLLRRQSDPRSAGSALRPTRSTLTTLWRSGEPSRCLSSPAFLQRSR